ncbi:cal-1, partial [Symbiodinium sp. CCMP2456]
SWYDLPDSLRDVETIWEHLDLAALWSSLLERHDRKERKKLSYFGGIRTSTDDVGSPCPYGNVESYVSNDEGISWTRDPGDRVWALVFDELVPAHNTVLRNCNADTKGDFIELTLGACQQLERRSDGCFVSHPDCLSCGQRVFARSWYATWNVFSGDTVADLVCRAIQALPKPHGGLLLPVASMKTLGFVRAEVAACRLVLMDDLEMALPATTHFVAGYQLTPVMRLSRVD